MHHIVYLHGLASSSLSSTPKQLQKLYPEFEVIPLELYHQCHRSLDIINTYLRTHEVDAVMGTSLGGFFALACDFEGVKIAVNPTLHPEKDLNLPSMMGTRPYLQKRVNREEKTYTMTEADLAEYVGVPLHLTDKTLIIQSTHDEVLGDYLNEAHQLLLSHLVVQHSQDEAEAMAELYHLQTDAMGHRTNPEFFQTNAFASALCSLFGEHICAALPENLANAFLKNHPDCHGIFMLYRMGWEENFGADIVVEVTEPTEDAALRNDRYAAAGYQLVDENMFGKGLDVIGIARCYRKTPF